ncbi:MAG: hypothetical protein ABSF82_02845 [Candidatus Bathyarchaeia archaeon]
MNHESVGLGERQMRKGGDRTVDNMKRCILIVLSVSMIILTSLGSAHAQSKVPVFGAWRAG